MSDPPEANSGDASPVDPEPAPDPPEAHSGDASPIDPEPAPDPPRATSGDASPVDPEPAPDPPRATSGDASPVDAEPAQDPFEVLRAAFLRRAAGDAALRLEDEPDELVARVLESLPAGLVVGTLLELEEPRREALLARVQPDRRAQWLRNAAYPEGTVGRLMDPALATFSPETTVAEATEFLRELTRRSFITYGWIVDGEGRLLGLLVFRELLFGARDDTLRQIMLPKPFALRPDMPLDEALRQVVSRHYPVYPVTDAEGRFLGIVRGGDLFNENTLGLTAQAGQMVGVDTEERMATPWWRCLRFRHPWLQLNLVTAFLAAFVVGFFEDTINRVVLLAAFLPVLAGQSGNTGCQALAVTLRGMTLGELRPERRLALLGKEGLLGLLNGFLVGLPAALVMFLYARHQGNAAAPSLALVVVLSMTGACVVSGLAGALIPLFLRRLGADPVTAASIFVTTATDVVSMGLFLGLATALIG
ncbi:MAG: magnesium transporter [Planctomycetes bacterium]|nr:magnesium transporter [Planctomycetota bacterium]